MENTLLSTQGNHDSSDFNGHITQTGEAGHGVYDVDYDLVKFIVLNNAGYSPNSSTFQIQTYFLEEKVKEAKERGQWVIVGFHKPIYTGASHIADGDVVGYRKALNPILTKLDVDMVLAGHDHVYSRGFIDKDGNMASEINQEKTQEKGYTVYKNVKGAPLHLVAEHAGGLKWYQKIDYFPDANDPIAKDYAFLDKNSAGDNPPSWMKKEQTYVIVEANSEEVLFTTYKMKYNSSTDQLEKTPEIYDQFSIARSEEDMLPAWAKDSAGKILEVNAHVGPEASSSQNISWTQVLAGSATLLVKDGNGKEVFNEEVKSVSNGSTYTSTVELTGLSENTKYSYTISNAKDSVEGSFTTAKKVGSMDPIRFAMICDPQIADEKKAAATGAVFQAMDKRSESKPYDFFYIAGDHTDNETEEQWFNLFHNKGLYPEASQKFFLKNTVLSTQGNHDYQNFSGHISMPNEAFTGVYDADYGPVKFIMLNNAILPHYNMASNGDALKQIQFLKDKVKEAKENGQWAIVGFHKPLYTGASHITDRDIVEYRKVLNPIFTEIGVDMVLAGHDHVYSRGFVDKDGNKASKVNEALTKEKGHTVYDSVQGAPLHLVAEHAGGLKWYSTRNYTPSDNDPIAPAYGFLDINSADSKHPEIADPNYYTISSTWLYDQTFVEIEASETEVHFVTYKLNYDFSFNQLKKDLNVYDEFTIVREKPEILPEWAIPVKEDILEVNAHVGADATNSQNITWTQVVDRPSTLIVTDADGNEVFNKEVSAVSSGEVFNSTVELTDLKANTKYSYKIHNGIKEVQGSFTTAKEIGSKEPIHFAMIADPQIKDAKRAKATGALFSKLNEKTLDFLFIAGDHTDRGYNNNQVEWFNLFHNAGKFPEATQEFFLNNSLVSTQGNHDLANMNQNIQMPNEAGEGVYDVDFGQVKFIVLNNASYNTMDLDNNEAFQKQVTFLKEKVAEAKKNDQWTIVGYHKPIYTGASHISDGDVIAYRKALNPILTELNVDMVLGGHDHVYSRGFINQKGELASKLNRSESEKRGYPVYQTVEGAPLHLVAEHAGALKWYKPINYSVTSGDPIVENYGFLDVNSAQARHPEIAPKSYEGKPSYELKDQTYVDIEVSENEAIFTVYKMNYNIDTDQVDKELEIYDQFAILKEEPLPEWAKPYKEDILEVNAHVGSDASSSQNITWTQVVDRPSTLIVTDASGKEVYNKEVSPIANAKKEDFSTSVELTDLSPNTKYSYMIDNGIKQVSGTFTTAKKVDSKDPVRFAMICDPQVSSENKAKATGAVFHHLSESAKTNPLDFLFIAGDHTDWNLDQQWLQLFHNKGMYPNATQDFFLENSLVSTQGNHDSASMADHINMPNEAGKGVYDVDFGQVKFIVLNNASYNTDNLEKNEDFQKQVAFLKEKVKEAKEKGQWTIVGYHKPIYTGASHISDGDVIAYRKALNPIFTELQVDMVLGEHDHVYSRGFINHKGELVSDLNETKTKEKGYPVYNPVAGAPLHLVGEHAGGLKWYRPVDYQVTEGDPIVEKYGFLDVNSAQAKHPEMAPKSYEGKSSSELKDQTYLEIEVTEEETIFKTFKFHYNYVDDKLEKEVELYEQFSILKEAEKPVEPEEPDEPEKPVDPEKPDEPEKPVDPKPSKPGKLPPSPPINLDGTGIKVKGYTKNSVYVRPEKGSDQYVEILPAGTRIEGLSDGAWVRFQRNGKTVYIAKFILTEKKPSLEIDGYLSSSIYVRPEKNSKAVYGILPAGHNITGRKEGAWTKITYKGKEAYIASKFIVESNVISGRTTSAIYVRPEKNSSEKAGILSKGSEVKGVLDGAWIRIFYNNQTAYIARKFVK